MNPPCRPYRVIQWATGSVGRESLRAVLAHPQLELAGVRVYSADKDGRDAGELCGADADRRARDAGQPRRCSRARPTACSTCRATPTSTRCARCSRRAERGRDAVPVLRRRLSRGRARAASSAPCAEGKSSVHGTGHPSRLRRHGAAARALGHLAADRAAHDPGARELDLLRQPAHHVRQHALRRAARRRRRSRRTRSRAGTAAAVRAADPAARGGLRARGSTRVTERAGARHRATRRSRSAAAGSKPGTVSRPALPLVRRRRRRDADRDRGALDASGPTIPKRGRGRATAGRSGSRASRRRSSTSRLARELRAPRRSDRRARPRGRHRDRDARGERGAGRVRGAAGHPQRARPAAHARGDRLRCPLVACSRSWRSCATRDGGCPWDLEQDFAHDRAVHDRGGLRGRRRDPARGLGRSARRARRPAAAGGVPRADGARGGQVRRSTTWSPRSATSSSARHPHVFGDAVDRDRRRRRPTPGSSRRPTSAPPAAPRQRDGRRSARAAGAPRARNLISRARAELGRSRIAAGRSRRRRSGGCYSRRSARGRERRDRSRAGAARRERAFERGDDPRAITRRSSVGVRSGQSGRRISSPAAGIDPLFRRPIRRARPAPASRSSQARAPPGTHPLGQTLIVTTAAADASWGGRPRDPAGDVM